MKQMRFRKSLTKNWPGGRRRATLLHETKINDRELSYLLWNHAEIGFKKPYFTEPAPSEGGMAEPAGE